MLLERANWRADFFMDRDQLEAYQRDKNFDRNESIWVLATVDKLSSQEIAKNFDLSEEVIARIISLHQKYWNEINKYDKLS